MSSELKLPFGAHRGKTLAQAPADYIMWLADPARVEYAKEHGKGFPMPILEAAQAMKAAILARLEAQELGKAYLGGKCHAGPDPIYVFECDGYMSSASGEFAFDQKVCATLDEAFDCLKTEYPTIGSTPDDIADSPRESPDAKDDKIIIWEVLPSGHRKAVWGFFGWHWDADDYACGQGTLPGDDESLYDIAARK